MATKSMVSQCEILVSKDSYEEIVIIVADELVIDAQSRRVVMQEQQVPFVYNKKIDSLIFRLLNTSRIILPSTEPNAVTWTCVIKRYNRHEYTFHSFLI